MNTEIMNIELKPILEGFLMQYQNAVKPQYTVQGLDFNVKCDIEKVTSDYNKKGLFKSLQAYSNISHGQQPSSHFDFFFEAPRTNRKFYIFGTDHGPCDYAVDKRNGKIALLEVVTGHFFFYVAKDEIAFLQALTKVIEFENYYLNGLRPDGTITGRIREDCINFAGGEEYSKLYKNIVISEDNMPTEPFILP